MKNGHWILGSLLFLCWGCSSHKLSWKEDKASIEMTQEELASTLDIAQVAWNKRHIKDSLMTALKQFEIAFQSELDLPKGYSKVDLATYLSRGYYQLGDYHETDHVLKIQAYKLGGEWAQRGLGLNKYFQTAIGERGYFGPGLKYVEKEQVGCLYWYLANIGKWALNSGVDTTNKYKDLVISIANRIVELDPTYYYGGIYRILGAYYAVIPSYSGGDLNKSRDYFQKSLKLGPEYIGTKVLMAQAFAVYRQDEKLFRKIIDEVLKLPLDKNSDIYPENYLEQKKADLLLKNIDDYFN